MQPVPLRRCLACDAREAIADLNDGATIMAGGFGVCGVPEDLLNATCEKGVKNLTVISNNAGIDGLGVGVLLAAHDHRPPYTFCHSTLPRV